MNETRICPIGPPEERKCWCYGCNFPVSLWLTQSTYKIDCMSRLTKSSQIPSLCGGNIKSTMLCVHDWILHVHIDSCSLPNKIQTSTLAQPWHSQPPAKGFGSEQEVRHLPERGDAYQIKNKSQMKTNIWFNLLFSDNSKKVI